MNLGNQVNKVTSKSADKVVGNTVNQKLPLGANQNLSNLKNPNSNIAHNVENFSNMELPVKKNINENMANDNLNGNANKTNLDSPKDFNNVPQGPKPGDKVGAGKEIGENGEVKDTSSKKLATTLGRGAVAYATGGESLGHDQKVLNNQTVDKAIGVVSDVAEKAPGIKELADELDDAGVLDAAGDVMDLAGNIKNGDISGAMDKIKNVKEDSKKIKDTAIKKIMPIIVASVAGLLFVLVVFAAIIGPVAGGFMDVTEKIGDVFDSIANTWDNLFGSEGATEVLENALEDYPDLSQDRQAIILAAASLLGWSYNWGGHPNGPGYDGVPQRGLDCGGYVQWVLWTALGHNPGYLTTSSISDLIGKKFIQISEDELLPGDIGLKYRGHDPKRQNHVGIFAGNNKWLHAAGAKQGIIQSKYKSFTIYLRYVEVT